MHWIIADALLQDEVYRSPKEEALTLTRIHPWELRRSSQIILLMFASPIIMLFYFRKSGIYFRLRTYRRQLLPSDLDSAVRSPRNGQVGPFVWLQIYPA